MINVIHVTVTRLYLFNFLCTSVREKNFELLKGFDRIESKGAKRNVLSSSVLFSVYSNSWGGVNPPPPFLNLPTNAASALYYVSICSEA